MKMKNQLQRINGTTRKVVAIDKTKATGSILELFEMAEKKRLSEGMSGFGDDE